MVTELEQKFFRVFEIEKASFDFICNKDKCNKKRLFGRFSCLECDNETKKEIKVYPEITAEKLLEMICIYNSTYTNGYTNYSFLTERNVKKLKEQILKNCLMVGDDIKQQIQQLFKE